MDKVEQLETKLFFISIIYSEFRQFLLLTLSTQEAHMQKRPLLIHNSDYFMEF